MKKNSGQIFETLQVDPINDKYYLIIPEHLVNELSWYEDSEISLRVEAGELVLSEKNMD